jgi:Tol biopolymer transport system component
MKFHSHASRPGRPSAFTPFSIFASAMLGLSLLASASAQDSRYVLVTPSVNDGALLGNSDSSEAAFSDDGRFIAFTSKASNLVALPTNGQQDVFVRDMQTGTTRLVSVNKDGTGGGNGASSEPRISADGRYVAFSSLATDLVAADANGVGSDVFVRDMQTGTTTLVTANAGGTITKFNVSAHPSMTPDGRYVAFFGSPPDLGDNVFVRDMQTGTTTLVSVNTSGGAAGGSEPVISANGRVVVFSARRDNLDQPPTITTNTNLFARDLVAGTTALITVNEAGTGGGDNNSSLPSISADGRYVAFHSYATNLPNHHPFGVGWGIYIRDLTAGVTTPVALPDVVSSEFYIRMAPAISADGRYVAYAYNYFGPGDKGNMARYDRVTGAVSTLPDAGLCAGRSPTCSVIAFSPSLSADGRFVAFGETASGDGFNEAAYFGDFLTLSTTNVTTQPVEGVPSELATRAVVSTDGRSVAFPTRNSLTQSNEHVNALNLYRFTPSNTDPAGVNGLIQFGTPSFRVEEDAGSISIPVIRGTFGGASGTATVDFATADRTATAGQDYVSTSGTLTFSPGEDVKFISVPLINDSVYEGVESFTVNLSNPTGGYALGGTNPSAAVVIHDSIKPSVTISDATVKEGEDAVFTVTLSESPVQPISIGFRTMDGTAHLSGVGATPGDYIGTDGTLVFNPGEKTKTARVSTLPDLLDEPDETFFVLLLLPEDIVSAKSTGTATIHNDTTPVVQLNFTGGGFVASETDGGAVISVSRVGGDPSSPFSVDYSTSDGTASERSDYTAAFGTLSFAAGEISKTFTIFITDDALVEPAESFNVTLSNPQGATLGTPSTASVTINSDDSLTPAHNPADDSTFFVRQHYRDFLNREADAPGLAFWTNEIEKCGQDSQCRDVRRINVSAAFFISIEFQNTGYFVYLLRQAAFNTGETLGVRTFLTDTQEVGRGVVVNQGAWQQLLEANKQALVARLASSPEFAAAYPASLTAAEYVDALNSHTLDPLNPSSGGSLTQSERDALASDLSAGRKTRSEVLRAVAENGEFRRRQLDKGFVYMQYVGYLRRNPGDPPDTNFNGYNFWLSKLDGFKGDFIKAEMVKAFISSDEYRHRFGQ